MSNPSSSHIPPAINADPLPPIYMNLPYQMFPHSPLLVIAAGSLVPNVCNYTSKSRAVSIHFDLNEPSEKLDWFDFAKLDFQFLALQVAPR